MSESRADWMRESDGKRDYSMNATKSSTHIPHDIALAIFCTMMHNDEKNLNDKKAKERETEEIERERDGERRGRDVLL